MIKLEKTSVMNFENAIRGARNPMNSWAKSDSIYGAGNDINFVFGKNDLELAMRLCKAGSDHRKFMRQIFVSVDITAPLYWWKEYDTYKVGTVANSCSTMHKIHDKEFTLDDFSHEHLYAVTDNIGIRWNCLECLEKTIRHLNAARECYLSSKDKDVWWQMIQLLPSSYNQKRTCTLTYENLVNMYHARKYHKLDEWLEFCEWIEGLPYSELITGVKQ